MLEGLGEQAHVAGVVVVAGRGDGSIAGHEEEAGAQLGRVDARLVVEIASVEVVQVEIAEHDIERRQNDEPGEGESAAAGQLDDVRPKKAREGLQESALVVDDEDPDGAHRRRKR